MNEWLAYVVTLIIVGLVLFAIFRGGQDNPVGTGRLQRDLRQMRGKVDGLDRLYVEKVRPMGHDVANIMQQMAAIEHRLVKTATSAKLAELEAEVDERFARIEERVVHMATKEDVGKITAALDHVCRQNDRTEAAVQRIEGYFLQRGIDRS
jgi:DNA-binding FrmR family transcriptional regulator